MTKKKVYDPLAAARKKPNSVKALALNPAAARNTGLGEFEPYRVFPPEIFDCTNLEYLQVFRGIAWDGDTRIPARIGELHKLKTLELGGLGFKELPAEIGDLAQLEKLDLVYSEALRSLPITIGALRNLRELSCGYCEALRALPAEIGECRELRSLSLGRTAMRAIPEELWQCTKLEKLYLGEDIARLPPGIAELTQLKELSLSPKAAASIASELPALTALTNLHINGKATKLPAEIGEMTSLVELNVAYVELAELPPLGKLVKLKKLDIAGNKLTSVLPLLAQLPKLVDLDYSDNPVDKAERRTIDALMKLPPSKRRSGTAAKPAKPVTKKQVKGPKPELVGKVSSINASLIMIAGDASVVAKWRGVGDGDDLDSSDWNRARLAMGTRTGFRDSAPIQIAGKPALLVDISMGSGVVEMFTLGEQLILVEGIGEYTEDELFLEWLATPAKKAKSLGTIALPTKTLALLPSTDLGTKAPKLKAHAIADFGDEDCGTVYGFAAKRAAISLEPPEKSSWGNARRCFVTPA